MQMASSHARSSSPSSLRRRSSPLAVSTPRLVATASSSSNAWRCHSRMLEISEPSAQYSLARSRSTTHLARCMATSLPVSSASLYVAKLTLWQHDRLLLIHVHQLVSLFAHVRPSDVPSCPDAVVASVESKASEHFARVSKVLDAPRTVSQVLGSILNHQGVKLVGIKSQALEKAVEGVVSALESQRLSLSSSKYPRGRSD